MRTICLCEFFFLFFFFCFFLFFFQEGSGACQHPNQNGVAGSPPLEQNKLQVILFGTEIYFSASRYCRLSIKMLQNVKRSSW